MNKTELITCLREPDRLSDEQLEELEALVDEYPYFLSARLLLAKASKEKNHPKTKKRIASAAVYSTDRILLKKYLTGNLFFLSQPPKVEEKTSVSQIPTESKQPAQTVESKKENETASHELKTVEQEPSIRKTDEKGSRSDKRPSALKAKEQKSLPEIPDVPSGHLDSILEELVRDMENLKASRDKFVEVQQKIEEDDAVSAALKRASIKESPEESTNQEDKKEEESKSEEESRKAASAITMQILDAAKKAKEEVVREDEEQKESEKKASTPKAEILEEAKKETTEEKLEPETNESSLAGDSIEKEKADNSEKETTDNSEKEDRAERVIREPRFSRFATRSYLKPPEHIDPTSFLDDDKDKSKAEDKKEETPTETETPKAIEKQETKADQKKESEESEDESSTKIKLPDLSKAKPVARKSKRKNKKEVTGKPSAKDKKATKETVSDVSTEKDDKDELSEETPKDKPVKTSNGTAKKAEEKSPKKASSSVKKKAATKKAVEKKPEVKKTTANKTVAKKTATKKTAVKKEPSKKASTAKTPSKSKSSGTKEEKKDDGKGDRQSKEAIIDKFIKDSPTIKYQRTDDNNLSDLAEESSAWDPNLASEYLAEIYLNQGNKKRAIEIYEALSLKYPEKKSYFADLISKIE